MAKCYPGFSKSKRICSFFAVRIGDGIRILQGEHVPWSVLHTKKNDTDPQKSVETHQSQIRTQEKQRLVKPMQSLQLAI